MGMNFRLMVALSVFTQMCATAAFAAPFAFQTPAQIETRLSQIAKQKKAFAKLHRLANTPGERALHLMELGPPNKQVPAVMVVANMRGDNPRASEAALQLIEHLVGDWQKERQSYRWYVIPVGNPDGYARGFVLPLADNFGNARPVNDDHDDASDEDGPEDLNHDGLITFMRQLHPEGSWLPVADNPVLMKKAEAGKAEAGRYRLYSEGIDNDGDGKINEDGPGGCNPGKNFPHNFKHYTATDGQWAGREPESRAVMRFAFAHPDIAMVLVFGHSNTLRKTPQASADAVTNGKRHKVPARLAARLGLDASEAYPLPELLVMVRAATGFRFMNENMLRTFLGLGAANTPHLDDLPYWQEIGKRYEQFIAEAGLGGAGLDPEEFGNGSIAEWAYYQYGVPTFSLNFWTLPKAPAPLQKEEEDVKKAKAKHLSKADPKKKPQKKDLELQRDRALYAYRAESFLPWTAFDHPSLGKVEIGGRLPRVSLGPRPNEVADLISKQLPFLQNLAALLPLISIERVEIKPKGRQTFLVEAWIANEGFLPYPSYQGKRNGRPSPVYATLAGPSLLFLEGRPRSVIDLLPGSKGSQKVRWLVQGSAGSRLVLEARSQSAGTVTKTLVLKGGKL